MSVSFRLWRFRLTTHGGTRYFTDWLRRSEKSDAGGMTLSNGGSFGYFGRASVSFALS